MSAHIVSNDANSVTIEITIEYESSMLASEESIQRQLNAAGVLASGKALSGAENFHETQAEKTVTFENSIRVSR